MTRVRFPLLAQTVAVLTLALPPTEADAQPVPPTPAAAEATPPEYRVVHCRTGKELTLQQLADALAERDVVYFGELHDNVTGHRVYAQLAALLVVRRADTVIAMEMFERDVQGVVTDYLRGRIDEAKFLEHSRPWKEYARDYRPLIELAKGKGLDVIAGNLPRPVAAQVASKEGSGSAFLPRTTTAPQDRYWELFVDSMKGHPGAEGAVERMCRAQCAKDDAMAESVAGYLAANPHRQPLVIHCNGNFHSDYGLGTAARVAARAPLTQAACISMVAVSDVAQSNVTSARKTAHYLLIVPAPPKPPVPVKPTDAPGGVKPGGGKKPAG